MFSTIWSKQQCLKEVADDEISIHTVEKSIDGLQDTSNSDVFGVSVKHEKAAKSLQRCMTKHSSPLSLRRLYQDECRELRRRGLSEVMNISGRVLRGQLVDERVQPKIRLVAQLANMCGTNNCSQVKDPGNLLKQEEF